MSVVEKTERKQENRIIIFDTSLRDGDQSPGNAMTIGEKVRFAKALQEQRVDVIEAGFPASSETDFKAVRLIAQKTEEPVIAALTRAISADIHTAASALSACEPERRRIHTFIATSSQHMAGKLRMSEEQVLQKIETSVRLAYQLTGNVEWSAEDATRSSIGFLCQAVQVAIDAGARTINLPDTLGYATPDEYASMFKQVIAGVQKPQDVIFSAHTHNDLGLAVANALSAVNAGARQVECTVKGIGERAGNAQLEAVVMALLVRSDVYPFWTGINQRMLKATADLHSSIIDTAPTYYPVVGDNAFAHASGIHQDGSLKCGGYEIMDARSVGAETSYPLTRHSGRAGLWDCLAQNGIEIAEANKVAFVEAFNALADRLLEDQRIRIVPTGAVLKLAQSYQEKQSCVL